MAAAQDTQGGDSFKSPGTGKGSTDSSSPLSQSRGGADPSNVNKGNGIEDLVRPYQPTRSSDYHNDKQ